MWLDAHRSNLTTVSDYIDEYAAHNIAVGALDIDRYAFVKTAKKAEEWRWRLPHLLLCLPIIVIIININIVIFAVDLRYCYSRSGWATGYSSMEVNFDKYPDLGGFIDKLHSRDINVILWA